MYGGTQKRWQRFGIACDRADMSCKKREGRASRAPRFARVTPDYWTPFVRLPLLDSTSPNKASPLSTTFAPETKTERQRETEIDKSKNQVERSEASRGGMMRRSRGFEMVFLRREMRERERGGDWKRDEREERESINKGQRERSGKYLFCGVGYSLASKRKSGLGTFWGTRCYTETQCSGASSVCKFTELLYSLTFSTNFNLQATCPSSIGLLSLNQ